jgi:hypothetical protein
VTEPRPHMDRFFGAALIAAGALVFALCGLCTLAFVGSTVVSAFRYSTGGSGMMMGLVMYGLIGGLPTIGGFFVMQVGWKMFRGRGLSPSEDDDPRPKPPPSAPPPG